MFKVITDIYRGKDLLAGYDRNVYYTKNDELVTNVIENASELTYCMWWPHINYSVTQDNTDVNADRNAVN